MILEENLFGNVLKSFRVRRGKLWTQGRTAELLGISRRTYAKWEDEDDGNIPSPEYLKKIAALFELGQDESDILYRAAAQIPQNIHNFPFPQNPFFTGRKTHLEQLAQLLQENESVAITQPISISGLGGIGKTQLALEYAHRYYPDVYRAVFWVNAADEVAIQGSYDALAQVLELPERTEQELYKRVEAVKRWLETHTNWLLIMDNADNLQLARSFFPEAHKGRILLTTRSQIVGNTVRKIEIVEMEPEEGLLFLLRRSGVLQDEIMLETVATEISESALQLVELLGGHPLALDQAGAYIEETGESFTEYINLYHEQRRELLNRRSAEDYEIGDEYRDHPDSVVTTFELCFTKARDRNPIASDILHFCAFLQPDAIPVELFRHDDSFTLDKTLFSEGIIALRRYSLIKRDMEERTFSIHRLVQAVLIDDMSPGSQMQWRGRVIGALNGAFPKSEFSNSRRCERLLPHALACVAWTEDELTPTVELAGLFAKAGSYLRNRGQYFEALTPLERVLSIDTQLFGVEAVATASAMNNLADLYYNLVEYEKARLLFEQALVILWKQLGDEHPETIRCRQNLMAVQLSTDQPEKYVQDLEELFSFLEMRWGAEHPGTIRSMSTLADLYTKLDKQEQAERMYQRVISIQANQLGIEHPDTLNNLFSLAFLYFKQHKDREAELLLRRTLKIWEEHLEADHPDQANARIVLAYLLEAQGQHEQAEALYLQALGNLEQRIGKRHPHTQWTRSQYAKYLRRIGRETEAEAVIMKNSPSLLSNNKAFLRLVEHEVQNEEQGMNIEPQKNE